MEKNKFRTIKFKFHKDTRDLTEDEIVEDDFDDGESENFELDENALKEAPTKRKKISLISEEFPHLTPKFDSRKFIWTYPWMEVKITIDTSNFDPTWNSMRMNQEMTTLITRNKFKVLNYKLREGFESICLYLKDLKDDLSDEKDVKALEDSQHQFILLYGALIFPPTEWKLEYFLDQVKSIAEDSKQFQYFRDLLMSSIRKTRVGAILSLAIKAPTFFSLAQTLFPKKIDNLLQRPSVWDKLEEIAINSPWKFGFEQIMYHELMDEERIFGLEASFNDMICCDFYKDVPHQFKDNLALYDLLKWKMRKECHICFQEDMIKESPWTFHKKKEPCNENMPEWYFKIDSIETSLRRLNELGVLHEEILPLDEGTDFYIKKYWRFESNIEKFLVRLPRNEIDFDIDKSPDMGKIRQDPEQLLAVQTILRESWIVISGMGGTGKTTMVLNAIKAIGATDKTIFAAPTGKAASVIRAKTDVKAYTIHAMLYKLKLSEKQYEFAVIDECSMVSVELLNYLFKELRSRQNSLKKVIFTGDVDQLPSIQPGKLLVDLFEAGKSRGCSVELVTNHRSEGRLLYDNAKKIKKQQMPEIDRENGFHYISTNGLDPEGKFDKINIVKKLSAFQSDSNKKIDRQMREVIDNLICREENLRKYDLIDQENSQIITDTNFFADEINKLYCWERARHSVTETDPVTKRKRKCFRVGDKIMVRKNSMVIVYHKFIPKSPEKSIEQISNFDIRDGEMELDMSIKKLMNGDIYIIREICHGTVLKSCIPEDTKEQKSLRFPKLGERRSYFVLDDLSGNSDNLVRVDEKFFRRRSKPNHAWAITVHKSQGSEINAILYVLSGGFWVNWQNVYTAVTRAKLRVTILGGKHDLFNAIQKSPIDRHTGLQRQIESSNPAVVDFAILDEYSFRDEDDSDDEFLVQYSDSEMSSPIKRQRIDPYP